MRGDQATASLNAERLFTAWRAPEQRAKEGAATSFRMTACAGARPKYGRRDSGPISAQNDNIAGAREGYTCGSRRDPSLRFVARGRRSYVACSQVCWLPEEKPGIVAPLFPVVLPVSSKVFKRLRSSSNARLGSVPKIVATA